jgi:lysophospholipase L1-like esterase
MTGFFRRLRDFWLVAGIVVLALVLIEVFFMFYLRFSDVNDPRSVADCYANKEWVNDYYKELRACNQSIWEPYVYWRRKPFNGEYINVNADGLRNTALIQHPFSMDDPQSAIFFFGGSSMWGEGVRDEYTIPSITGLELSKNGYNLRLKNFGETGFVSTQDVIRLMLELKKGNIPDYVVFYGGLNDVISSLENGRAGIPMNEDSRGREYNSLSSKKKSVLNLFYSLRTLATIRFIKSKITHRQKSWEFSKDELELLVEKTVQQYNENIRLINALGRQYGFKSIFYWQPSIFYKSVLSPYEKSIVKKEVSLKKVMEKLNSELYPEDLVHENIRFYNLTYMFSSETDPLFIDWYHTGETGNILISKRIVKDLLPLVDSKYESNTRFDEQD